MLGTARMGGSCCGGAWCRLTPARSLLQPALMDGGDAPSSAQAPRSAAPAPGTPQPFLRRNAGLQRRATASISSRYVPKGGFILEVQEHRPKVSKLRQLRAERRQAQGSAASVSAALKASKAAQPQAAAQVTVAVTAAGSTAKAARSPKVTFKDGPDQPGIDPHSAVPASTKGLSTRLKGILSTVTQTNRATKAQVGTHSQTVAVLQQLAVHCLQLSQLTCSCGAEGAAGPG